MRKILTTESWEWVVVVLVFIAVVIALSVTASRINVWSDQKAKQACSQEVYCGDL